MFDYQQGLESGVRQIRTTIESKIIVQILICLKANLKWYSCSSDPATINWIDKFVCATRSLEPLGWKSLH